eukprot:GFYU01012316.1.p1 GENE.GFYU01012316.1~~GFYU01012316.1.p1  ORF type:complete len:431 (-),score=36.24 GFYU01012316.1:270-1427(-)
MNPEQNRTVEDAGKSSSQATGSKIQLHSNLRPKAHAHAGITISGGRRAASASSTGGHGSGDNTAAATTTANVAVAGLKSTPLVGRSVSASAVPAPSVGPTTTPTRAGTTPVSMYRALGNAKPFKPPTRPQVNYQNVVAPPRAPAPSRKGSELISRPNLIVANHRQKGNPILPCIRNCPIEFSDIVPDFLLGGGVCALYLSLRFHLLNKDYLFQRIRELQRDFRIRLVICLVDVADSVQPIQTITKTTFMNNCTLLLAWSLPEAARYLETFRAYESKPADSIKERVEGDYMSKVTDCLTVIKSVNKTDVVTLKSSFGSVSNVISASVEQLALCPGIGEKKAKRLCDTFQEPFLPEKAPKRPKMTLLQKHVAVADQRDHDHDEISAD